MSHVVYEHLTYDGTVLYVGQTADIRARTRAHRSDSTWFKDVAQVVEHAVPNREIALLVERILIRSHRPYYNTRGKELPSCAWWPPLEWQSTASRRHATLMAMRGHAWETPEQANESVAHTFWGVGDFRPIPGSTSTPYAFRWRHQPGGYQCPHLTEEQVRTGFALSASRRTAS